MRGHLHELPLQAVQLPELGDGGVLPLQELLGAAGVLLQSRVLLPHGPGHRDRDRQQQDVEGDEATQHDQERRSELAVHLGLDLGVVLIDLRDSHDPAVRLAGGEAERHVGLVELLGERSLEHVLAVREVADAGVDASAERVTQVLVHPESLSDQARLVGEQNGPVRAPDLHPHDRAKQDAGVDERRQVPVAARLELHRRSEVLGFHRVRQDRVHHELGVERSGALLARPDLTGKQEGDPASDQDERHECARREPNEQPGRAGPHAVHIGASWAGLEPSPEKAWAG